MKLYNVIDATGGNSTVASEWQVSQSVAEYVRDTLNEDAWKRAYVVISMEVQVES